MKLDPPTNTDRPLIYDGPGDWSALYVDEFKPGRYPVPVSTPASQGASPERARQTTPEGDRHAQPLAR